MSEAMLQVQGYCMKKKMLISLVVGVLFTGCFEDSFDDKIKKAGAEISVLSETKNIKISEYFKKFKDNNVVYNKNKDEVCFTAKKKSIRGSKGNGVANFKECLENIDGASMVHTISIIGEFISNDGKLHRGKGYEYQVGSKSIKKIKIYSYENKNEIDSMLNNYIHELNSVIDDS